MKGKLELGVLYTGLGLFSYNVLSKLQQQDIYYAVILVMYMLLGGLLQRQLTIEDTLHQFRVQDSGLLYCLILPLSVGTWTSEDGHFVTVLIPLSWLCYATHCRRTLSCNIMCSLLCIGVLCQIVQIVHYNTSGLGLTIMLCLAYILVQQSVPMCFPRTFSFGELSIEGQMYIYLVYCVLRTGCRNQDIIEVPIIEKAAAIIFILLNILVLLLCSLKWLQTTLLQTVTTLLLVGAITALCVLSVILPARDIKDLIVQLVGSKLSILLLLWWICCTVLSIFIVCYYGNRKSTLYTRSEVDIYSDYSSSSTSTKGRTDMNEKQMDNKKELRNKTELSSAKSNPNSVHSIHNGLIDTHKYEPRTVPMFVRKYFHVVILAVFVPGMMYHPKLLYVASCAAAAVFIIVEIIRVLDVPLISGEVNKYLTVFLDKQDQGDLILTPIYLLIGCSFPLWIIRPKLGSPCSLVHYSGLISVGVGDAAASVVGRKFGHHTWPGSNKTVEGTFAAFLAQLAFLILLQYIGVPGADVSIATMLILILISCLEAFTQHIDNLVVPIYATMLFSSIQEASVA